MGLNLIAIQCWKLFLSDIEFKVNRGGYQLDTRWKPGDDGEPQPRCYQPELRIGKWMLTSPWFMGMEAEIQKVEQACLEALRGARF